MSRTDAHEPYWVKAQWWEPWHGRCQYGRTKFPVHECNLPPEPTLSGPPQLRLPRLERGRQCVWDPIWPPFRQSRYYRFSPVPKWFRDHRWNNPERVRMRGELRDAVKEFNATGDVVSEVQSWQHRHGARWDWD